MSNYKIKSYAKLNLGLKILNKRPDNFHNIHSIFLTINLFDILEFYPSKIFSIECSNKNVPTGKENIIYHFQMELSIVQTDSLVSTL